MKAGTKVTGVFISDSRFLGGASNIETVSAALRSGLRTAVSGEGVEIWEFGEERKIQFDNPEPCEQIRQEFTLILATRKTKTDTYKIVNSVQSTPLKFIAP